MAAPGAFVIFGATGDLARRMLFPSLYFLDADGLLPDGLRIIGAARSPHDDDEFRGLVREWVQERAGSFFSGEAWTQFAKRLTYCGGDATARETYAGLKAKLGDAGETIFYLSTSPALYTPVVKGLAAQGLTGEPNRIIVEKPIGKNLKTYEAISNAIAEHFSEQRTFRIDHYLGKETVQNLIALRFANALFEPLWNRHAIDHVQITVAETLGVEGRFSYYDEYGAMRDMVQNHLLQLLCLIAMEPPSNLRADSVRGEKVKVLRALRPIPDAELPMKTVRGQYTRGVSDGQTAPSYVEEEGGKPSDTETFVAICAHVDNWRWAGVPFYLRTGKRMPKRSSQIVIEFRDVPHSIFNGSTLLPNRLTITLQPEESISLTIMNKTPTLGGGFELQQLSLNLSLLDAFKGESRRRIAYERLLLEAINNNSTLFVRRDEAEAAWLWVDRIVEGWARIAMKPASYPAGSWGPAGAFALTERNGHSWYE
ncbi:MAG TPA: glucose-6-phosphate dehydrogenase [Hyphomonadaceae bacterium]|nr:glucose-6-phosphate dehydrogenase [Hyphomonadaceae bacterium]